MSNSDGTCLFSTNFIGRGISYSKFTWTSFATRHHPPDYDYVEGGWKSLSLNSLMPWIHDVFGPKAVGCTTPRFDTRANRRL